MEGKEIPKDWKDIITIPIYEGKNDAMQWTVATTGE